jgi:hypothetical protein
MTESDRGRAAGEGWLEQRGAKSMGEIKTDEALLTALRRAAARGPSPREIQEQRISFIAGMVSEKSGVTRARIQEVLAKEDGGSRKKKAAA